MGIQINPMTSLDFDTISCGREPIIDGLETKPKLPEVATKAPPVERGLTGRAAPANLTIGWVL